MASLLCNNHFSYKHAFLELPKNIFLLMFFFVFPTCLVNAASNPQQTDVQFEAKYQAALTSAFLWLNDEKLTKLNDEKMQLGDKLIHDKYLFKFASLKSDERDVILKKVLEEQLKKEYVVDSINNKHHDNYKELLKQDTYTSRKAEIFSCDSQASLACRELVYKFISDYGPTAIPATNYIFFAQFRLYINLVLHPELGLNESVENYRSWIKLKEELSVLQSIPSEKLEVDDVIQLFKLMDFMFDFLSKLEALEKGNGNESLVHFIDIYSKLAEKEKTVILTIFAEEVNKVLLANFIEKGNLRLVSFYFYFLKDDTAKKLLMKSYQSITQEQWKSDTRLYTEMYGEQTGQVMQDFYFAIVENKRELGGYVQFMEAFPNSKYVNDKKGYIATHLKEIQQYQRNQKIARIDQYRFYCAAETTWGKNKTVFSHYKNVDFLAAGVYDDEGAGLTDKLCQKALEHCESKARSNEECKVKSQGWMHSNNVGDKVTYRDVYPDYSKFTTD